MRPAQKAPENYEGKYYGFPLSSGFNEAGAKSAGKHPWGYLAQIVCYELQ